MSRTATSTKVARLPAGRAGKRAEAFEAVPDEYVDQDALIGPKARIAERYRAWAELGVDGLTLHTIRKGAGTNN